MSKLSVLGPDPECARDPFMDVEEILHVQSDDSNPVSVFSKQSLKVGLDL